MTEAIATAQASTSEIRPSPMWTTSIVAVVTLALVIGAIATITTIKASRFIGEGQLLFDDAARSASRLASIGDTEAELELELKRIRNDLGIEAVSMVGMEARITTSTSPTLIGLEVGPMLARTMAEGRFVAVASPTARAIRIDGVTEWEAGAVLYEAMHPVEGGAILLSYDVSELLHRRMAATQIPPHVVPMAVVSGTLMLVAAGLAMGRARTTRTRREMAIEAEFFRRQSFELRRHNQELEMARAETEAALALAEEKNRIRSEFVLMINHELRTPLTGVVTGARLLEAEATLSDPHRQLIDDMIADGDRLEAIIGQMLAVARVENRGLKVVPVEMSIDDLAMRLGRAHRGVHFTVGAHLLEAEIFVKTDATTLAQLAASLADNALTHGARSVQLTVTTELPGEPHLVVGVLPEEAVHVIVSDDGPGIDAEFLPLAFEKFQKSGRSPGTGLGLHFSKMMAESIGASISVHTSPSGTWMAISIPARITRQFVGTEAAR